jgi:hypothetical protein
MPESGNSKSDSILRTVLVAVLIALAAGGSAPWWWNRLFPPAAPTVPAPENSGQPQREATLRPERPKSGGLGACASGAAPSLQFHDVAAPNGSWDWNCDGQVEREFGTCENLTREQCDPNTNVTKAPPGFCTQLRTAKGCTPNIGQCGQSGWIYPCFYDAADGRCHAGGYETAAVMRCK